MAVRDGSIGVIYANPLLLLLLLLLLEEEEEEEEVVAIPAAMPGTRGE